MILWTFSHIKMTVHVWILLFIMSTESLSIGVKQNVTKREIDGNLLPDWVSFKNKNGADLGEFVDVAKSKPKKRLALPVNFVMKAVAEGEDDYNKDQGESDSNDYYEKKEWADLHRPAKTVNTKKSINRTDIADIDSIVKIITKPSRNIILEAIKKSRHSSKENTSDEAKRQNEDINVKENDQRQEVQEKKKPFTKTKSKNEENKNKNAVEKSDDDIESKDEENSKEENESKNKNSSEKDDVKKSKDTSKKTDDNDDDYEDEKKKQLAEDKRSREQRENAAKKAQILSSVDELKERHAEEQRSISEKMKEEEMFKDELERELERTGTKRHDDKYAYPGSSWKKITQDYDDDEDHEPVLNDKYKINSFKITTTTTTISPKKTSRKRKKSNKKVANGKLSVFRNPNLYTVNDEEDYKTTPAPKKANPHKPEKYSSRYSENSNDNDNIRISLIPLDSDSKDGEPTLFYPQKRKSKRIITKTKTSTPIPDLEIDSSEESSDSTEKPTKPDLYVETGPSASDTYSSASNTASTAETGPVDTAPSASDTADTAQASTEKKEKNKDENYHRETGEGRDHHSEHDDIHEEHGKKAYEGVHKDIKTNKGHHDKENHLDKYDDHGGIDKHHHEHDDHYGSHHHEEHGKKHAKYEESGKHSKGHSTKGSHDIHKKEEYEKKVEFFEEEGDSDDDEHDGGYHSEKEHSSGGHFKKGELDAAYDGKSKGNSGHFSKGGHGDFHKGHKSSVGKDTHGKHGNGRFTAHGHDGGKHWVYHHGHPAKNANLVIIDRRADAYQHGPLYYG